MFGILSEMYTDWRDWQSGPNAARKTSTAYQAGACRAATCWPGGQESRGVSARLDEPAACFAQAACCSQSIQEEREGAASSHSRLSDGLSEGDIAPLANFS
jgi:hypothetical protein